MSKTKGTMKGMRPISQSKLKEMTEYIVDEKYTREIPVSERVSYKIRKTKVISPEGNNEGVDIRRFIKMYPSRQGCMIPLDKWLTFIQQAIDFTTDVFGKEVFYSDEPEPQTLPTEPEPIQEEKQREISPDELRKMSIARKSAEEVNWADVEKIGKSRRR